MSESVNQLNTVPDLLKERALLSPDGVAFWYQSDSAWLNITWGDFWARVQRLAAALRAFGLQPEEHVGILAPTGFGWELFHHAVLVAGGVVVGLDPHDTPERLQWIADHADLRVVIVQDSALLEKISNAATAEYRVVILLHGQREQSIGSNVVLWAEMEEGCHASTATDGEVFPSMPATLIYTSGTTGQPKGIVFRHEQVTLAVRAITSAYPSFSVDARFICWLPLSNLFQRIMNLAAIKIGGSVYLVSDPRAVQLALPIARPDVFIGVPRFYEKLHESMLFEIARKPRWLQLPIRASILIGDRVATNRRAARRSSYLTLLVHRLVDALVLRKLRSAMGGRVRFMITGSAPTPMRLLEFFDSIGLPLYEAYGLSENIVPMALNRPGDFRFGTVGKALPENTLRIEKDGELLVRGGGVFEGYRKGEQSDMFTHDGFYKTGDYASVEDDGFLRLVGRKSEIIKTSTGRRISPIGIEQRLEEVACIDRAVVIGSGRKCLVAILSLRTDMVSLSDARTQPSKTQGNNANLPAEIARQVSSLANQATRTLPDHERPAGFLLLCRPLSIEQGELTTNLKLRRNTIEVNFATQLDSLFCLIEHQAGSEVATLVAV